MARKRAPRLRRINVSIMFPIISLFVFWMGVILYLYGPTGTPKVYYPTVLGSSSSENYSVFRKLLDATYTKTIFSLVQDSKDDESLFRALLSRIDEKSGTYSVYIKNLKTGKVYEKDAESIYTGASLYKIPTAISIVKGVEEGRIKLTDTIIYTSSDTEGGSGVLNANEVGTYFTVEQLLTELIRSSDNVAQNMFSRRYGYNYTTEVIDKLAPEFINSVFIKENRTTPLEVSTILERSLTEDYLNPKSKKYLFDLMSNTLFDDRISVHLDEGLVFAHKIGNWPDTGSWHDCGLIFDDEYRGLYVVCLMSEGVNFDEFMLTGRNIAEFINTLER